ncbi:DUF4870 domain-containing protein [Millisia brevis]|uniref:DUF4870 domain-containing protein n=1 Tax=Millisia brevis TaxID=264148 RepID=UPI001C3F33BC|nr:DUF4870 domain-containing protein [Millisia brevis]
MTYQQQSVDQANSSRLLAVLAHLSAPIAALLSAGFLSILGPLIIWLLFRDNGPLVRTAAAGAFNFNLSFWVLYLVAWVLNATVIGLVVGIPLLIIIFLVSLFVHLRGMFRALAGKVYEYPFQIRILS